MFSILSSVCSARARRGWGWSLRPGSRDIVTAGAGSQSRAHRRVTPSQHPGLSPLGVPGSHPQRVPPDFQMSRCACSTSPPRGERWRNCSSDMAHSSLPPSSWKALPTGGSRYWCSVHRSHFCTLPGLQSTGSGQETLTSVLGVACRHHPERGPLSSDGAPDVVTGSLAQGHELLGVETGQSRPS